MNTFVFFECYFCTNAMVNTFNFFIKFICRFNTHIS